MTLSVATTSDGERGPPPRPLPRAFFERAVEDVAVALLGVRLVRRWPDGTRSLGAIVEVEAYGGPEDRASHARSGRTARNAAMFGPSGRAYVYRVYGLHTCLNVVAGPPGTVGAVLVRAVMPLGDPDALRARRDRPERPSPPTHRLAAGPGNVGAAFGIGLELDGSDLTDRGPLWLAGPVAPLASDAIVRGPRIGVAYAGSGWADRTLRFGVAGHPALSRPFPREA